MALTLGGLVLRNDVGGECDHRTRGGDDGDCFASAGACGASNATGEDAGGAAENSGVFAGGHVFASGDEKRDRGGESDGFERSGFHITCAIKASKPVARWQSNSLCKRGRLRVPT